MNKNNDNLVLGVTGEVFDTIVFTEDTVYEGVQYKKGDTIERNYHNLVVQGFTLYVSAMLMRDKDIFENMWWEVGSGSNTWVDTNLPKPTVTDTSLLKPTFRKVIPKQDVKYLDSNNEYTTTRTNKVEISTRFNQGEGEGDLREFGIFMGGTPLLGSGIMLNRKIHEHIYKSSSIELHRKIHFTIILK